MGKLCGGISRLTEVYEWLGFGRMNKRGPRVVGMGCCFGEACVVMERNVAIRALWPLRVVSIGVVLMDVIGHDSVKGKRRRSHWSRGELAGV